MRSDVNGEYRFSLDNPKLIKLYEYEDITIINLLKLLRDYLIRI